MYIYQAMEPLQYKVRKHLCSTAMQPDQHHQTALIPNVVTDRPIRENNARKIPTSYEMYSLELLKKVSRV
jgi:hypothetical protein